MFYGFIPYKVVSVCRVCAVVCTSVVPYTALPVAWHVRMRVRPLYAVPVRPKVAVGLTSAVLYRRDAHVATPRSLGSRDRADRCASRGALKREAALLHKVRPVRARTEEVNPHRGYPFACLEVVSEVQDFGEVRKDKV